MARKVREESSSSQNVKRYIQKISERGTAVEIKISDSSPFFIMFDDFCNLNILIGDEISPEKYEEIEFLDEKRTAISKSINLLSISSHTKYLLKLKLLKRGFSSEASEDAVKYLSEKNLVNDREYAQQWVRSRLKKNPSGPYLLKGMLIAKGVDRETAEEVVNSMVTEEVSEEAILRQVEKLKRNVKNTDDKIIKKLLSKGFSMKEIRKYYSGNL